MFGLLSIAFFPCRWNLIIHGGIDGFSRLVPHLIVTSDNKAISALRVFITGLRNFGVPSRIRVDGGSEFVFARGLMNLLNGDNRNSALTGSSVHNQRMERRICKSPREILQTFLSYGRTQYSVPRK